MTSTGNLTIIVWSPSERSSRLEGQEKEDAWNVRYLHGANGGRIGSTHRMTLLRAPCRRDVISRAIGRCWEYTKTCLRIR